MEIFLSMRDIFNFAIRIEEDGEAFYREAAKAAKDLNVKGIFVQLASEEIKHREKFESMRSKIGEDRPHETYDGEYFAYLKDHIDGKVIFTGEGKDKLRTVLDSPLKALEFAIEREIDSITYYQEMRSFLQEKYHKEIEEIIKEERNHFLKLSDVKKRFQEA
ncbi:MAG: ferritin family protein [Syntrophorhabdaceae bacterium]|nr:ferritin family protein [Syntrophorhabdaceae bacterium]